jgi:hypothetical protein
VRAPNRRPGETRLEHPRATLGISTGLREAFVVHARIRLQVPDRPGSLGRVASAIGGVSGDIAGVDVLGAEAGQALDDVVVAVRDVAHLDEVLSALGAVAGVRTLGVHHPEPPLPGHGDLQLVAQVLARPVDALRTLVDGAPAALGVDWAALVHAPDEMAGARGPGLEVVATSAGAPDVVPPVAGPLRLRALSLRSVEGSDPPAASLVPLEGCPLGLVLVRGGGLAFHTRELWRLGQLGAVVGPCLAVAAPTQGVSTA